MFWGEVHRQKRTGEGRVEDFIFAWRSRLNIWRTLPERRARIVGTGFIIAAVAFIGRRVTALEFWRSTIVGCCSRRRRSTGRGWGGVGGVGWKGGAKRVVRHEMVHEMVHEWYMNDT